MNEAILVHLDETFELTFFFLRTIFLYHNIFLKLRYLFPGAYEVIQPQ